jgi:flagellin
MTLSNIASMNATNQSNAINTLMGSSLEKLTTGYRINKASDDVSGMAIADKLRTQASGLEQAAKNGNSAIALLDIAEGGMKNSADLLDQIKTKLIQATDGTTNDAGRENIRKDIKKLLEQIDDTATNTTYNGIQLLAKADGSATDALTFQMGDTAGATIDTDGAIRANSVGLGLDAIRDLAADGLTATGASGYLSDLDDAIDTMSGWRGDVGASRNQLSSSVENILNTEKNLKAAESVIRDVDYAKETANFNKLNIQAQAGSYASSQANTMQQSILRLLQ